MGALPKQRISKSRQGKRRGHDGLKAPALSECPRCGEQKQPHHVCPTCGTYNGISVIEPRKSRSAS
jgi:large subunit ribosomal protein L32